MKQTWMWWNMFGVWFQLVFLVLSTLSTGWWSLLTEIFRRVTHLATSSPNPLDWPYISPTTTSTKITIVETTIRIIIIVINTSIILILIRVCSILFIIFPIPLIHGAVRRCAAEAGASSGLRAADAADVHVLHWIRAAARRIPHSSRWMARVIDHQCRQSAVDLTIKYHETVEHMETCGK